MSNPLCLTTTVVDVGYLRHISGEATEPYTWTPLELLASFVDQYPDFVANILSYHYGDRDYVLESKYDNFYSRFSPSIMAIHFKTCYKSEAHCTRMVKVCKGTFRHVPDTLKTPLMCRSALINEPYLIYIAPIHLLSYSFCKFIYDTRSLSEALTSKYLEVILYLRDRKTVVIN